MFKNYDVTLDICKTKQILQTFFSTWVFSVTMRWGGLYHPRGPFIHMAVCILCTLLCLTSVPTALNMKEGEINKSSQLILSLIQFLNQGYSENLSISQHSCSFLTAVFMLLRHFWRKDAKQNSLNLDLNLK